MNIYELSHFDPRELNEDCSCDHDLKRQPKEATNTNFMKLFRILYLLIILLVPAKGRSQDTIIFTKQQQVLAKMIEIDDSFVKYRKFDNSDSTLYSAAKNDIIAIYYNNGNRDIFRFGSSNTEEHTLDRHELLNLMRTPNTLVFVTSTDTGAVIHARRALQHGTSWNLVDNKSLAKFMVRFLFVGIGMGDKKGRAQFLDPKTGVIVLETNIVNTTFNMDINTKRGVIDKIVNKEIKRLIKGDPEF